MKSLVATLIVTTTLLAATPATHAALDVVEQAYEIDATLVERWPLGDTGSIVLRPCAGCDTVVLGVDANTKYRSSRSSLDVTREELMEIKSMLSNPDDALVYIFYRPDDSVATRIVLDAGN